MEPGMLSGIYHPWEVRFHVKKLAEDRGATFIKEKGIKVDPLQHLLYFRLRRESAYGSPPGCVALTITLPGETFLFHYIFGDASPEEPPGESTGFMAPGRRSTLILSRSGPLAPSTFHEIIVKTYC